MVIAPIFIGGFGNRLYQLAHAFMLSDRHGTKLELHSISPLPNDSKLFYAMGVHRPEDFADFGGHKLIERPPLPSNLEELFPKLEFKKSSIDYFDEYHWIKEGSRDETFTEEFIVIHGYFFGYSNIAGYTEEVRKCFNPIIDGYLKIPPKTLGVHLRLGINTDNFIAPPLNIEYYNKILKEVNFDRIYVFTDNLERARAIIGIWKDNRDYDFYKYDFTIIENNPMYLDMLMMSKCDTLIMSSSTLSAWSGYFSKGTVYTPKRWLAQHSTDIPANWIVV